ncbi:zinc ribbon domain-containing protein [Thermogemmatispora sp.]|uniref:zinc ribbon domain-containing protein n=1 Tax=Thermogemmatispora sp. TaxID=1968838 RepID=UPI0035E41A31
MEQQVHERGRRVVEGGPACSSQRCARCGRWGTRRRHAFTCPCGAEGYADSKAARPSLGRAAWTALWGRRRLSISPGARADQAGCGQAPGWSRKSVTLDLRWEIGTDPPFIPGAIVVRQMRIAQ